ncbi:neuroblast differentiation-associated protein AHNAK-like isoform X2 [Mugil cephalus]|nr:neuroblast differentiation-associated protein AHNAK-like isoform X2 [Mugil cephalus]
MFEKRSTPKMSKLKEVHSPESEVIVKTAKEGCAEGLVYGGGGKDGIFIKQVVPESPASKSLKLKEGDQLLSATVYFDNVSYEDAIQILEHAQAYKVKLCLKRKPDIADTEAAVGSDIIPEEELYAPEMREQGKTKSRGDARISWPKFSSFGKGRKSRFTRSHSSSEADEQRKLELSPTTSDTESPIKSQDALKGKKRHKMKLPALKKRGRISSSEDQDTEAPTTGQISFDTHQTSDMISPECLESPSGAIPQVYVTEDVKVMDDFHEAQTGQHKVELITIDSTLKTADLNVALADPETPPGVKSPDGKKKKKERSELKMKLLGKDKPHKKDAKAKSSPKRLKTLGASFEIADQPETEKPDTIQSLESPTKQFEDQPALDTNTQIISTTPTSKMEINIPKVELDVSNVMLIQKSPKKSEQKSKKGKQKQETGFKLPKIGLSDIDNEGAIQKVNVNVQEFTTKIESFTTDGTEDPYERLSKSAQLPKREDIVIPGMEDRSRRTTAKGIKEPKAFFKGQHEDIQAEAVQLSIDVDSVKEAVSKLPGYKLPKVDTSGVPIPEEITVIDANAQRISVKTPTKVVDTKTKHEAHFRKFDITASPQSSKTTVKLPNITSTDLISEELLTETRANFEKFQKEHKITESKKQIKIESYNREDIIIPGKETAQETFILQTKQTQGTDGASFEYESTIFKESDKKSKAKITMPSLGITKPDIRIPDIGIHLPKQKVSEQKGDAAKEENLTWQEEKVQIRGAVSDVKIPEIDGIEFIDSVDGSPAKSDGGIKFTGVDVHLDAKPKADILIPDIQGEVKDVEAKEHKVKLSRFGATTPDINVNIPDRDKDTNLDGIDIKSPEGEGKNSKFKMPNLGISIPKMKGPKIDSSPSKKNVAVTLPETKAEVKLSPGNIPETDITLGGADVSSLEVKKPELETKPLDLGGDPDVQGSRFKMPRFGIKMPKIKSPELDFTFSKKDADVKLPEPKGEVQLPEAPEMDITIGSADVALPEQTLEVKKPELETKPLELEGDPDVQGSKFKMPKFGIKMPKIKSPEFELSLSKKDADVELPDAQAEVQLPEAFENDVTLGSIDVSIPKQKMEVEKPEVEVKTEGESDGQGIKFKMPKLGISVPKVKGPEFDVNLSKKDVDVMLPEAKGKVQLPDVELKESYDKVEIKAPEIKVAEKDTDGSPSKFKMPSFKMPKFGIATSNVSAEVSTKIKDTQIPERELKASEEGFDMGTAETHTIGSTVDVKSTAPDIDGKSSKFKMPKFGISLPKVKGPEIDLSLSKKDITTTMPKAEAEVKLSDVECTEPALHLEAKAPEFPVHQDAEGSPSKFKMPTFKLPKLETETTSTSVEISGMDKDVKIDGADINISVEGPAVNIESPSIEVLSPSTEGAEHDVKGSKFKMPQLGFSRPKVKGPKIDISLPKKDSDVKLPKADLGEVDVSTIDAKIKVPEVKVPESTKIDAEVKADDTEKYGGKFKMPKFGIKMPKVKGPEFDFNLSKKDVDFTPEAKADIDIPDVEVKSSSAKAEIEAPELEVAAKDIEGSSSKFKMPSLSLSSTQVKGPEINVSLPKKETDITLPENVAEVKASKINVSLGKAEVLIPEAEVEVKKPEVQIKTLQTDGELEREGGHFKMPKFGFTMPKGPEIDLNLAKTNVDVTFPEAKPEVKLEKFKVEGDARTDVEITLPEAKADVSLPGADIKVPSMKGEIKTVDTDTPLSSVKASQSKFKMPSFKFPKFGATVPHMTADVPESDTEMEISGAEIHKSIPHADFPVPEIKAEVDMPDVEVKESLAGTALELQAGVEIEAKQKKSKFSLPRFSFSKSSVKSPEADVSFQDVNVAIPEGKVEIKEEKVDIKPPECEVQVDEKGSKFKTPQFAITMPKVTGPKIDLGLSKTDVDVSLPEAKAEVKLPDVELKKPSAEVEIKAPEMKIKDKEGSPSKFKMPSFKLPKFGVSTPSVTAEVPDMDKGIKIDGADIKIPEEVLAVEITAPSIDIEGPSVDVKTTGTELEGKGSKFQLPSLGFSGPQVKGPSIDLTLPKKDVDVTLPEAKAEVKLPDVELKKPSAEVEIKAPEMKIKDKEGSPSKFKMPSFKLPKFGVSTPSVTAEVPDMDKDIKIDGADIKIPEEVLAVDITAPSIDIEGPSVDVKTTGTELEGKGSKFKLPSLGFSGPQVKGPSIDLTLPKKDLDVTLPEAKAEVKLPDVELKKPSAEVEIKAPEMKIKDKEGSPSKFKMPSFKLPKFGVSTPSVTAEVPDMDKGIKIDGADIKIPEEVLAVEITAPSIDIEGPSVDVKTTGTELEGKGSKFQLPSLGFSGPQVKGPSIDLTLPKKDVDVTLPEAKAEVKLPDVELKKPSAEVEIKAPEMKIKDKEGSPSKFKMPSFKLPKFGVSTPSVTAEVPDMDKDIKIDGADIKIPEEVLAVDITAPSIDIEGPSVDVKTTGTELEGKGSKFKLPSLGFSGPQVKGPSIDLTLPKKDLDVTLPEAKAEVKLPDVELKKPSAEVEIKAPEMKMKDKEGSPSKFKMPSFKLPKFGVSTPSVTAEVPDMDKDIKTDGADIKIPEEVLAVEITAPSIDIEGPSVDVKTTGTELEGKGSKFQLPSLGFSGPQVKGPSIDLTLPKKDVDVTLPEAKAEVKLPDVELKKPSAEVEIKAPEMKIKDKEGSPSKFKMPSFKLPKFGVSTPSVTAEVPDMDKDIKIDGADIKIPEEVLAVDITAPSIDIEGPSVDVKTTGTELEGKGSKFKFPSLGFSGPQVKGPSIDLTLTKKDVDVSLPEAKADIKLPDVELKKPSAEVEIEAPEMKMKDKEGSPSKFKMPTFKLPKFGVSTPSVTAEVPDMDKDIKIDGADIEIPEEVLAVDITAPSIDIEGPSVDVKTTGTELEGKGSKFKFPSLGFSGPQVKGPSIDLTLPKKDVDVTLPEAKAEVKLPDVKLKKPSAEVEIKAPEMKMKDKEGSPSKFKMPSFKLPKFGVSTPSVTAEVPDMDKDIKIDGADIKIPEEVLAVDITAPSIDIEGPSVDVKTTGTELEGKGSKFKLPSLGFSGPQVKGPSIDLTLPKKDVDVTLPEAKAEVKLPDVELKKPSAEVEIKAPEMKIKDKEGSPSKFKMPSFKLPKFGVGTATAEVPDMDKGVKIDGADIKIPEEVLAVEITAPSIDIEGPSVDVKTTGTGLEGKGSKFQLPSLGFSGPQVKGPGIDLTLPKKDVDVTLPEAKAEVKLPEMKDASVKVGAPGIDLQTSNIEGSPSTFKMPTIKLPKVGAASPHVSVELPDMDKDLKVDGENLKLQEAKAELPDIEMKEPTGSFTIPQAQVVEGEAKLKKPSWTMPRFSFSKASSKTSEDDTNLDVPKVDVKLPKAKTDMDLPAADIKDTIEGSASVDTAAKLKKPRFSLPKISFSKQSIKEPEVDVSLPKVDVSLAEGNVEVKQPDIELKSSDGEIELDGQESKFKMPKFGITMPKVKDLNISKTHKDVVLPEIKAEVQLPDVKIEQPSAKVEIEAPEIEAQAGIVEVSSSKLKMPTITLPTFGGPTPKISKSVPDMDKGVKIDGADIEVPEEVLAVEITAPSIDIEGPSVDVKTTGTELEGKGSKFKFPSLGFSGPRVKGPDIDVNLSKKDVDVTLPEAEAEVKLPDVELKKPSAEVEIKAPEMKMKDKEGSPSKFKMPTFKLPKFGVSTPSATAEVPDMDKGIKIDGADIKVPEEVLAVEITAPSIDIEGPSVDVKTTGTELEGKGSKFKFPSLGFSGPQVKGPSIDLTLPKKDVDVTLPEAKAEVELPDVELKKPSAEVEIKAPEMKMKDKEGSPSKFKMPTFKLPKFGVSTPSATAEVPDMDKDIKIDGADIKIPEEVLAVDITAPSIDIEGPSVDVKTTGTELEGKGSKFKFPSLGFSGPHLKGPNIDLTLPKKDVDVTLPKAEAEVKVPDAELKKPSAEVEMKAPEMTVKDKEGSPSKFKMPTFKLPKFGVSTPSVTAEVPDMDKGIKIDGADIKIPEEVLAVEITAPSIDIEGPSVDVKTTGTELEGKGSKFKLPSLGFSGPQVKGPGIDLTLPKKDVDVTLPEAKAEVKLPTAEDKEAEGAASVPDAPTVEAEAKQKRPNWTFPKFSLSRTSGKAPDADVNLETPKGDVLSPEAKVEVSSPDVEVKESSGGVAMEEPPAAELDTYLKKSRFSLPRFSFSKSSSKETELSAEVPRVDVSLSEGQVKVKHPEMDIKVTEIEARQDGQGGAFKLPKFGISQPKAKGLEVGLNESTKDVDITLPEVKAEAKLSEAQVKEFSTDVDIKASEAEANSKDVGGSPLKFKMPTLKMPKFGSASYDVTTETPKAEVPETDGAKEDVSVTIKGPSLDIKTDVSKESSSDTAKTETDGVGLVSPSKFKLPSFKMPRLSFSKPKPEDEYSPVDTEDKESELKVEPKGESKSPKLTLKSFGDILKTIDVEFDVPKVDEDKSETPKEVHETLEKQLEAKEITTKQETTKSPERTGWFKFPKFGLSSPSEQPKISEDNQKDENSPTGETGNDELSPSGSVQSSDAFADISSAITSEHAGLSLSSPTKVTVKYSDPNTAAGLGEMHSNIITSTTRTELIPEVPNLPEKITILSSGVSSSSEDTLQLQSGKIHIITTNIQATPEAQHATLLTPVQIQSVEGLPLESQANEAASWSVEESQSGKKTVFERHVASKTSSGVGQSGETIVITKQITRVFDSSEPISGETASSIQRLRDSVHSEKMKFFDGAEK